MPFGLVCETEIDVNVPLLRVQQALGHCGRVQIPPESPLGRARQPFSSWCAPKTAASTRVWSSGLQVPDSEGHRQTQEILNILLGTLRHRPPPAPCSIKGGTRLNQICLYPVTPGVSGVVLGEGTQ
ncbi:hypothetical protein EI555_012549 [Monodon monoceros]|uniref:Uncharacterized protein n=1 Tax=Monodon monoceros TaxID=40151 RepID=A0A4U1F9V1_MONMO|nr:hypothetical protein EI555_012549 [Monodon monoceros]